MRQGLEERKGGGAGSGEEKERWDRSKRRESAVRQGLEERKAGETVAEGKKGRWDRG